MNMVAGGEQSGYGILSVREQLWMFSQFYGLPRRDGWRRVDELIDAVGLEEQRTQRVSTLSTGQRQKMNFARGLLTGTAAPDGPTIALALLGTGALVTLGATVIFRVSERRAKDRGLLDQTTGS
jgi:ABC-2 type transport system ATP-binding protein